MAFWYTQIKWIISKRDRRQRGRGDEKSKLRKVWTQRHCHGVKLMKKIEAKYKESLHVRKEFI